MGTVDRSHFGQKIISGDRLTDDRVLVLNEKLGSLGAEIAFEAALRDLGHIQSPWPILYLVKSTYQTSGFRQLISKGGEFDQFS